MKKLLFILLLPACTFCMAQEEKKEPAIAISAYLEAYYSYDFSKPADHNRPAFLYSHNRHQEFNLNIGFLKASWQSTKARANLALAAGTYINSNYQAEPGVLKNIYEANAGIKLHRNRNLWLDAGIFRSHIGFESAISKDCWTLTRSIAAENSPYYESGAKITYTDNNSKWLFSVLALNGWQRIKRVEGNSMASWGAQIQYKPSDKLLLNYSNFIGTDKPDSTRALRVFHNLYGIASITPHLGLTLGFDLGTEERSTGKNSNTWFSPQAILRYSINDKWSFAMRGEYYSDSKSVIVTSDTNKGFRVAAYSINLDCAIEKNVLARIEARQLKSKEQIFENGTRRQNTALTGSIAIHF